MPRFIVTFSWEMEWIVEAADKEAAEFAAKADTTAHKEAIDDMVLGPDVSVMGPLKATSDVVHAVAVDDRLHNPDDDEARAAREQWGQAEKDREEREFLSRNYTLFEDEEGPQ